MNTFFDAPTKANELFKRSLQLLLKASKLSWLFGLLSVICTLANRLLPTQLYPFTVHSTGAILLALVNLYCWLAIFYRIQCLLSQQPTTLVGTFVTVGKRFFYCLLGLIIALAISYVAGLVGKELALLFLTYITAKGHMAVFSVFLFGVPLMYVGTLLIHTLPLILFDKLNPVMAIGKSWVLGYRKWYAAFLSFALIFLSFALFPALFHVSQHWHHPLWWTGLLCALLGVFGLPYVATFTLLNLHDLKIRRAAYEEKLNQ